MRNAGARGKSLHQFVVLLRVQVAVSVQHDRDRGVAGHRGDMLGVCSLSDPERDRGVPEIVYTEWFEAGCSNRRAPDASTEERGPYRESRLCGSRGCLSAGEVGAVAAEGEHGESYQCLG